MKILNAIVFIFLVVSCSDTPKRSSIEKTTYHEKLEFIKKNADTSYNKYSNDSTIRYETYQFDTNSIAFVSYSYDTLLAIVFRVNGIDTSVSEYYPNGQIIGKTQHLDNGKIDGKVTYYYPNGRIRSLGQFNNGKWWGKWKNFDEEGYLIEYEFYDEHGKFDRIEKIKN
jgi:antitoxin component YwqK of YwqJK toxin-antitoxin module